MQLRCFSGLWCRVPVLRPTQLLVIPREYKLAELCPCFVNLKPLHVHVPVEKSRRTWRIWHTRRCASGDYHTTHPRLHHTTSNVYNREFTSHCNTHCKPHTSNEMAQRWLREHTGSSTGLEGRTT